MHELNQFYGYATQTGALDAAIRASLSGKLIGISTYDVARSISIWMDDSASSSDDTSALAVAAAHDPVFVSTDKTSIPADGVTAATVTVLAPKPGAAAVTLQYSVNGGAAVDWPITLINGVGTDTITALDAGTVVVVVKNPANRSTDQLTIVAR